MDSRTYKKQLEREQQQQQGYVPRNGNSRLFFVALLFFGIWGGCYYVMDKNDTGASNHRFCEKHSVTYSINNAYGDCPKCEGERQAEKAVEGLERKIYGR